MLNIMLSYEKAVVINFKNNAHIFSILIINKKNLRFKNNFKVSIKNAQRNLEETFTRNEIIVIINNILRDRAFNLKKKIAILSK